MLLLIDKPSGYTSFDVVKKAKRIRSGEKVGHAGTLDPQATGLMILGIGKSTKRLHHLSGVDKSYSATIDFSRWSDTRDSDIWNWEAQVTHDKKIQETAKKRGWTNFIDKPFTEITPPSQTEIQQFCETLLGDHLIAVAPFSAKKVDGKKLYQYAREGNPVHKNVPMKVIDFTIEEYNFPTLKISFTVGSGTYIRSLAQTIGNHFGLGGILTQLRRTAVGKYSLKQLK